MKQTDTGEQYSQDGRELRAISSEKPLTLLGLTAAYRDKPVLWDVSLKIPEAELVAVVGPNGAGKTTLLKVVMDLMKPAAGRALVYGKPFSEVRQRVGYVPQRGSVDWDFPTSALDVVMMGLYGKLGWFRRPGTEERETAMECLDKVGLASFAERQISQLSGGQQQRVFLARALAQDADLYLTDEPFAAVDYKTERAIVELLRELKRRGKTVVVVHHDLGTVAEYFDRVVILNGSLVAQGPVAEVFNQKNLSEAYGGNISYLAGG